jgi:phenylacetate-CoA ligase
MKQNFLSVLRKFVSLRDEQWKDRETIEMLQRQRLERVISCAADTGFYSQRLESPPLELASNLPELPITTKEDVRDDPEAFLRRGVRKDSLKIVKTSGSTGVPLTVYMDRDAFEYRTALFALAETEFGRSPFDLFVEIAHTDVSSFSFLSRLGIFRKTHLWIHEGEDRLFSALCRLRPDIVGWYPSTLSLIAGLNDDVGRPLKLKSLFCGGEVLTGDCRRMLQDSFSCPVFNHYGAHEFGTIAWECPEEHNLHVNSSTSLVEILDRNGRPKKSGTGELVVTNLHNKVMPFLRFSIGDVGSWGNDCPCGRGLPVLKSLEGRSDDYLVLPSGKVRSGLSMYFVPRFKGVSSCQIVQEKEDLFVFRHVLTEDPLPASTREDVKRLIKEACLGEEIDIEFEAVDSIKKEAAGKIRRVISKVKRPRT